MIDKSSLLKSQGSLYLEFIPKDGLFHKMLLLSLMGFLTGWCNLKKITLHVITCFNNLDFMCYDGVFDCFYISYKTNFDKGGV